MGGMSNAHARSFCHSLSSMETLKDLVALVAGGTGNIGSATVRAFLALGATVVVPSRSQQRLDDLIATLHESRYLRGQRGGGGGGGGSA